MKFATLGYISITNSPPDSILSKVSVYMSVSLTFCLCVSLSMLVFPFSLENNQFVEKSQVSEVATNMPRIICLVDGMPGRKQVQFVVTHN